MSKVALVTGANRGMGFECCRQLARLKYRVILTSRDEIKGRKAVELLKHEKLDVTYLELDVSNASSILVLSDKISRDFGRLDVLINNAGIFIDREAQGVDVIRESMETNVYGPYLLCEELIPLMKKNNYGRIVNVSSGMGQLSEMNGGYPGYRISKTALNAVTRIMNDSVLHENILVNSVCPGWVKTDMGGASVERSISEGVECTIWLATLPDGGPRGLFFRDKQVIPW